MGRVLIIARTEFVAAVHHKGFIAGLLLVPLCFAASVALERMLAGQSDRAERRVAVVDESGAFFDPLARAAAEWNAGGRPDGRHVDGGPSFVLLRVDPSEAAGDLRVALSDRVRRHELFAFVELPRDLVDPSTSEAMRYYSATPSYRALPDWLHDVVGQEVLRQRFARSMMDSGAVAKLLRPVGSEELGLLGRDERGEIREAKTVDRVRTLLVPTGYVLVLFIVLLSTTPQLLNSVLEEKMSRISEVLLGSVSPFQLMMGKLLANTGVSLVMGLAYVAGAVGLAHYHGYGDAVTPWLLGWLFVYLSMAVLMYGAIFIAIGAACTDLKDAQSLMGPAMLLIMVPAFTFMAVVRAPDSPLAVALTLIPTATPFLQMVRMALQEPPPVWQVSVGFVLTTLATLGAVWAAGKIFRTGLLMQGKSATLGEMWRWVRA